MNRNSKYQNILAINHKKWLTQKSVCTVHAPNEKHAMTSRCLDRKYDMRHLVNAQYWTGLAGGNTGRLSPTYGGPVCADRISNCPMDRMY